MRTPCSHSNTKRLDPLRCGSGDTESQVFYISPKHFYRIQDRVPEVFIIASKQRDLQTTAAEGSFLTHAGSW